MISQIKSKYIIKQIFNYIKDKNMELKLFSYSKYLQNRLSLKYYICYKKYLDEIKFDLNKYLYREEEKYNEKEILKKEYNILISKNNINKENFEKILYEVINHEKEKYFINIDSPLLEIISKINDFDKYFTLYISQKNIDKYKLKDKYRKIIEKLNYTNTKYSSIVYIFNKRTKLNYLNELNINCKKIRRLDLIYNNDGVFWPTVSINEMGMLSLFTNLE